MPGREGVALASMGIYVIGHRSSCARRSSATPRIPNSQHDFGRNIIPEAVTNRRVFAYPFEDVETKAQRYWRDVGTVDAYYSANMELIYVSPELNLVRRSVADLDLSAAGAGREVHPRRGTAPRSRDQLDGRRRLHRLRRHGARVAAVLQRDGRRGHGGSPLGGAAARRDRPQLLHRERDHRRRLQHPARHGDRPRSRRRTSSTSTSPRTASCSSRATCWRSCAAAIALTHSTRAPYERQLTSRRAAPACCCIRPRCRAPVARGTLGAEAWRFVDWLAAGGFTRLADAAARRRRTRYGSPYCLRSAYAGDPRFSIDADLATLPQLPRECSSSARDRDARLPVVRARSRSPEQRAAFAQFVRAQRRWLLPYGLFELCSARFGSAPWWLWPEPFRERALRPLLEFWPRDRERFRAMRVRAVPVRAAVGSAQALRERARRVSVRRPAVLRRPQQRRGVVGRATCSRSTRAASRTAVAGVPPDYFNADGQLWGNPLYDWDAMERDGFRWWLARLRAQLAASTSCGSITSARSSRTGKCRPGAQTAREGEWRHGPRRRSCSPRCAQARATMPLVAEDLGIITDEVRALRDDFELPGMVVLQFAFDGKPDNPHLPRQPPAQLGRLHGHARQRHDRRLVGARSTPPRATSCSACSASAASRRCRSS